MNMWKLTILSILLLFLLIYQTEKEFSTKALSIIIKQLTSGLDLP